MSSGAIFGLATFAGLLGLLVAYVMVEVYRPDWLDSALLVAETLVARAELAIDRARRRLNEPEPCTGDGAAWCPNCGSCTCPESGGDRIGMTEALSIGAEPEWLGLVDRCALHGTSATHNEPTRWADR